MHVKQIDQDLYKSVSPSFANPQSQEASKPLFRPFKQDDLAFEKDEKLS